MDLSIGPISNLYPTRLVQRATGDLRLDQPPQAEPPARSAEPTGPAGVRITLSAQAMLALQGLHPPAAAAAETEFLEDAGQSEPSPQENVGARDHQANLHVDDEQAPAPGVDAGRADLIGARTAYRMAASIADAGRSGVAPGVDLAA